MEKKIVIFTYMLNNYGAVLQAYALQQYIRSHSNHIVKMLDYYTDYHRAEDRIFKYRSSSVIKTIALKMLTLLRFAQLKRRKQRTEKFKSHNFIFTDRYSSATEVLNRPPQADIYISGSDQVFNIDSTNFDVYFLNFKSDARKIAYAPSFGIYKFNDTISKKIHSPIRDFDVLSCREESGAKFLSQIVGEKVPVVADPTLLLSKEEWAIIAVKPESENYICIYDLNGGDKLVEIAQKIKNATGWPIICITSNIRQHYKIDKVVFDAGPAEFVGLIAHANFIVTDSFHGTMFSLIFRRDFYTYIAVEKSSDRITSILNRIGLKDRIISKCSNTVEFSRIQHFDEDQFNSFIQHSKLFLETAVDE